ncbi:MAG: DNA/RNA non-specific endonuclease [Bacteroidales bacterium]|nr:DNA/RNA non-specific endonuclease [Bacteroidales bacterium]
MNTTLLMNWVIAAFTLLQFSCANVQKAEGDTLSIETPRVVDNRANQVITHKGYSVSYNKDTRLPNWVAYELTNEEVNGTCKRNGRFFQDPDVRGRQADNDDYRNTGWDKGHIAPAGDMKWDEQAMLESCYFTNVCPQNHNLNGGDWRSLEEKCRDYAQRYGNVYIAAGPVVGENRNGVIGNNLVVIPDAFYKVLLISKDGRYEGVGFYFENVAGHKPLTTYVKSIDEIEALTNIDFFFSLPDDIENTVESTVNEEIWFK